MRKIQSKFTAILAGGSGANFTAMPQVGGDPIVESGSNADGEWTRFSDGTQICLFQAANYDISSYRSNTSAQGLTIYRWVGITLDFPIDFTDPPSKNQAFRLATNNTFTSSINENDLTTEWSFGIHALSDQSNDEISFVELTAIGRWK
jgi:hypothetical protein